MSIALSHHLCVLFLLEVQRLEQRVGNGRRNRKEDMHRQERACCLHKGIMVLFLERWYFLINSCFYLHSVCSCFSILRRKLILLSISHLTWPCFLTAALSCPTQSWMFHVLLTSKVLPEQKLDIDILSLQWLAACPPLM